MSIICSAKWCYIIIYYSGQSGATMDAHLVLVSYPLLICDFVLNLSLFTLFIYKIKQKDTIEGVEVADDLSSMSAGSDHYNYNTKAIWNVMIKHCILIGIALISNQAWYVTMIIGAVNESDTKPSSTLIKDYTARTLENTINIVILWLILKVNNNKYVYLCKCWHSCILKYCMKEDPNIIREGFADDDNERILVVNQGMIINNSDNAVIKLKGMI